MANPLELDFFASPILRTVRHPLWVGWNTLWTSGNQLSGGTPDTQIAYLSTKHSMSNGRSFCQKIFDGNARPWFMQHDRQENFYMREMVTDPEAWELDTYNRLRFFVRPARGQMLGVAGSQDVTSYNFHWGTYCRDITAANTSPESDNMHYYHHMQMLVPEKWNQFIIDWHPHRQRNVGTSDPIINQYPQPETSPGHNYFDLLTRHYNKCFYWLGSREEHLSEFYPGYWYMDHFEIYEDAQEAPDAQDYLYALSGVYDDSNGSFHLGWSRQAGEVSTIVEVRYAFTDAIQLEWENLLSPPNNRITSNPGERRENMTFITTDIDPSGNDFVYFALKHDDYTPLRQIVIPVVDSNLPPLPPSTP